MTLSQVQAIMNVVEEMEIKDYSFLDDIQTRYYNSDRASVIIDEGKEMLWNIRAALHVESDMANSAPIAIIGNDLTDIRRFQFFADAKTIETFAEKLGLELTDEDKKKLVTINSANRVVKPLTGDYTTVFHVISKESYDKLTPEEKAIYDENLRKDKERFELPKGSAAQINVPQY